jgi:hypothetical protein
MAKKCGTCGTMNDNSARNCKGCGSPFFQNKLDNITRDIKRKI